MDSNANKYQQYRIIALYTYDLYSLKVVTNFARCKVILMQHFSMPSTSCIVIKVHVVKDRQRIVRAVYI